MARDGKYSINISWYNLLGGIERFNFTARKTYGYTIGKPVISKRDIFNDWSVDFAGTETDLLDLSANETIVVRSQNLTEQQINAISQIRLSPLVTDEDQSVTVQIDRRSFDYRTEHNKRYSIQFKLTYPDLIIPTL